MTQFEAIPSLEHSPPTKTVIVELPRNPFTFVVFVVVEIEMSNPPHSGTDSDSN